MMAFFFTLRIETWMAADMSANTKHLRVFKNIRNLRQVCLTHFEYLISINTLIKLNIFLSIFKVKEVSS